jgi:nucleoside-diphosphate-sugar epimerase
MSTPLVLITGTSGHLGFRVLVLALEAGYSVVSTIRKVEQAMKISEKPSVRPHRDRLSFAVVKDIAAPGAFDEAMKSVTHVIHVASPIASPSPDSGDGEHVGIHPASQEDKPS